MGVKVQNKIKMPNFIIYKTIENKQDNCYKIPFSSFHLNCSAHKVLSTDLKDRTSLFDRKLDCSSENLCKYNFRTQFM